MNNLHDPILTPLLFILSDLEIKTGTPRFVLEETASGAAPTKRGLMCSLP